MVERPENSVLTILVLAANWMLLASGGGLPSLALIWLCRGVALRLWGWNLIRKKHPWLSSKGGRWRSDVVLGMVKPSKMVGSGLRGICP